MQDVPRIFTSRTSMKRIAATAGASLAKAA